MKALITGLVLFAILAASPQAAFAITISDPDSLTIESVNAYDGVINADDLLVVIAYRIDYGTLPALAATDAFLGRFLVDGAEVNASEIVSFNDLGYGLGVSSVYFTAAEKVTASIEFDNPSSEDYEVSIQGKPSAFSDPPQIVTPSITYRDSTNTASLLQADVATIAESLENDAGWLANSFDMITFTTGQQVLTANGEAYLGQAIPNLQIMIPDLFGSSTTAPQVFERTFGTSEEDRLNSLWDNSPLGPIFSGLASDLGLSKIWIMGIIGVIACIGGVWLAFRTTGDPEYGILTLFFSFPLVTSAGLGTMSAIMFVAALGVLGLLYSMFLRRAA